MNSIEQHRQDINLAPERKLLVIVGPCSDQLGDTTTKEGEDLTAMSTSEMLVVHRRPVWKPRSDPASWHGIAETEPMLALEGLKVSTTPNALEIGNPTHQPFLNLASFAWIGARSVGNKALQDMLIGNPSIPFGIKTKLDGSVHESSTMLEKIVEERSKLTQQNSAAFIIHRSGAVRSPEEWEQQLRWAAAQLHKTTRGRGRGLIVDTAHGAEMAHDPQGKGRKTIQGQARALEHTIQLLRKPRGDHGLRMLEIDGLMIEASDVKTSPDRTTDPNLPIGLVKEHLEDLQGAAWSAMERHKMGGVHIGKHI